MAATVETVLDALVATLRRAADYNREDKAPPVCILWPDPQLQWARVISLLRERWPALVTLGPWDEAACTGPAIWIKTVLERRLGGAHWPADAVPIVYLPGVARADLRSAEDCEPHLLPLVELQFRGTTFLQANGREWTVGAFLRAAAPCPNLDVATDAATNEAAAMALDVVAARPVAELHGRRLQADDFRLLLVNDIHGQLLRWLDDPEAAQAQLGPDAFAALAAQARTQLAFDPVADGQLQGAKQLLSRTAGWARVWNRFEDAVARYPNLPGLLDRAAEAGLANAEALVPAANRAAEDRVRDLLRGLDGTAAHLAAGELRDLEAQHAARRDSAWGRLGQSPLAHALLHLAALAQHTARSLAGATAEDLRRAYTAGGWQADAAVLHALAAVRSELDVAAVATAIRVVYLPWLRDAAEALQKHLAHAPNAAQLRAAAVVAEAGDCIVFADGLRFDVGQLLATALTAAQCTVALSSRWAAVPTVTATCKVAASPVADLASGPDHSGDFAPAAPNDRPIEAPVLRALLRDRGFQLLGAGETGDPSGRAWTECGALDTMGHAQQWKLAWRIDEEVAGLARRVSALLAAGWRRVRVVTDHGWLLVPGGLPKAQLPPNATLTKWSRCAILHANAHTALPTAPWAWSPTVRVALAPNIATLRDNNDYAHGGWSLQEAVTPELLVTRIASPRGLVVTAVFKWTNLRCNVTVEGAPAGAQVGLRARAAHQQSSLAGDLVAVNRGQARLFADEDKCTAGAAAILVVLDAQGRVLWQQATVIGGP